MPPHPPASPLPPYPPQPRHGPPTWAWWVVGILIPVLGLVVTLITQTGRDSGRNASAWPPSASREAAAPGASAAPEAPAAPDAQASAGPGETADTDADTVTTLPPSPSPSPSPSTTAAKILRTGDFTLRRGDSADLEHGTVGESVAAPDMAWNGGDEFSAMNGRVADTPKGATPKTCAEALEESPSSTGWMVLGLEGMWFCMPTSANHLAAVEWLGSGDGGERYHYIVWDVTAPSDATP